jgi:hypothetical protein
MSVTAAPALPHSLVSYACRVWRACAQITRGLLQKHGAERVRDTPITEVRVNARGGQGAAAAMQPHVRASRACARHGLLQLGTLSLPPVPLPPADPWTPRTHPPPPHTHTGGLHGHCRGQRVCGHAARVRVHDLQLCDAGDRPDRQLGRQDALHVGGPDLVPHRVPGAQRRGGGRGRAALAVLCRVVQVRARACFAAGGCGLGHECECAWRPRAPRAVGRAARAHRRVRPLPLVVACRRAHTHSRTHARTRARTHTHTHTRTYTHTHTATCLA